MSRAPKTGLCGICRRHVILRKDGKLRGHLAERSSPGRREQCEGSGRYSVRVELLADSGDHAQAAVPWSRAAEFNTAAAWNMADTLWAEYVDMVGCGAADTGARHAAYAAYSRAWHEAQNLSRGLYSHHRRPA